MSKSTLGILSVATNIYIDYWEKMILSLESNLESDEVCVSHVFTDQAEKAKAIASNLRKVRVCVHTIPPYRWPDATLRRYEIFATASEEYQEDVLMHLDADMLFLRNVFSEIIESVSEFEIALVAHPGFWGTKKSIRELLRFNKSRVNTRGSWESRSASSAYVPPKSRKAYVCGGVWIGKRTKLIEMIKTLDRNVELDRQNGIEAVWHDESHLNKWASENEYKELSPSLCFVEEYKHLKKLIPGILAVTKTEKTR